MTIFASVVIFFFLLNNAVEIAIKLWVCVCVDFNNNILASTNQKAREHFYLDQSVQVSERKHIKQHRKNRKKKNTMYHPH